MPRGGYRPGAGRKRGSLTKRTTEIAQKAMLAGITPLEVMLGAMYEHWAKGRKAAAAAIAKDAAPYMHPRLASIDHAHGGKVTLEQLVERSYAAAKPEEPVKAPDPALH